MTLQWNPYGVPGVLAGAAAIALAWFVYSTRPRERQNRFAALFIALSAGGVLVSTGLRLFAADGSTAYAFWATGTVLNMFGVPMALAFYGTLPSPLSAPLRRKRSLFAATGVATVAALGFLAVPTLFSRGMTYAPLLRVWYASPVGPLFTPYVLAVLLVTLYGVAVAATALRAAGSDVERRKTRIIAWAFGLSGAITVVWMAVIVSVSARATDRALALSDTAVVINFATGPFTTMLLVVLLSYGILRAQVFDIDLKVKWTIRQSTVAAIFIGVFFVVSEAAQEFFGGVAGSQYLGILAAGALAFAIAPLQRLAERVSDAALPAVRDSDEYRTVRRRELYRAALASAMRDGTITDKERDMLATLQDELGITATEARDLERDIAKGVA